MNVRRAVGATGSLLVERRLWNQERTWRDIAAVTSRRPRFCRPTIEVLQAASSTTSGTP
jgi:hypothetical protein